MFTLEATNALVTNAIVTNALVTNAIVTNALVAQSFHSHTQAMCLFVKPSKAKVEKHIFQ